MIANIEKRVKESPKSMLYDQSFVEGIRFAIREMVEEIESDRVSRIEIPSVDMLDHQHMVIDVDNWLSLKERLLKLGEGK